MHDPRTIEIGKAIFAAARAEEDGDWRSRLMEMGMRDEAVKAQLFRFVDVLAVLDSPKAINRHLSEYLNTVRDHLPRWQSAAIDLIPHNGVFAPPLAKLARFSTTRMARQFIAATNLAEAELAVESLREKQLAFTMDLLGEAVLSETEAEKYQQRYFELIDGLADRARRWQTVPLIDRDVRGPIPAVNVSVKLSSLYSQFDPIDPEKTSRAVRERLRPILRRARERGVFVNIDMEQFAFKDVTLRIFREIFTEPEFRDWPDVGIAMQAYLRSTESDLHALADWSAARGTSVWVRLVKGAYWDYETVMAAQNGWPIPVFEQKADTDANFEKLTGFLFENTNVLRPAIASHNIRSIAHAIALAEAHHLPLRSFEFQMLYGMADPVKHALASAGYRVRVYTPFGELLPGMAYLVRRLLENSSNESFLRAGFAQHVPEEKLLMNPLNVPRKLVAPRTIEFRNEPVTDFSREESRQAMRDALQQVKREMGRSYPLLIGADRIEREKTIASMNSSHRNEIVGKVSCATVDDVNRAISVANRAFESWRETTAQSRGDLLKKSAEILRRRRFEIAAWEVYETAKPWREADADIAEAIDFCEFYARETVRLNRTSGISVPGEENTIVHEPRGVTALIAPWNFPMAILCGMTTAALAAGNTVIMKPAEQSSTVGAKLMEVFVEAGFPPGVVNYLPGIGEEIGPALVSHPNVAMIAFTGSRAVGLAIQKQAAAVADCQIKGVITELGGKNAIIVDDDADIDEAVQGIVASAFGYAGQKCSACSRVIAMGNVYDSFLTRLIEATRSLTIGPADDPGTFIPPVIDEEAKNRIERTIESAKSEAKLVYAGELGDLAKQGSYVAPHIFTEASPDSAIAQEEIFGPVLVVLKAADLTAALRIANGTRYALTGGVYSRSPANIERVRREFRVGNLYINRKITGALVGRQPFGGFKLSGTGPQAGGGEYLLQFMHTRVITENTLRRGFAVESE